MTTRDPGLWRTRVLAALAATVFLSGVAAYAQTNPARPPGAEVASSNDASNTTGHRVDIAFGADYGPLSRNATVELINCPVRVSPNIFPSPSMIALSVDGGPIVLAAEESEAVDTANTLCPPRAPRH